MAREIDLAAGPRGAMESVLSLLSPPTGLLVREQAALALGAIAEEGYRIALAFQEKVAEKLGVGEEGTGRSCGSGGKSPGLNGGALREGEGNIREGTRLILWRRFCSGVVGGKGAQVGGAARVPC